jgi:hypothetical protein
MATNPLISISDTQKDTADEKINKLMRPSVEAQKKILEFATKVIEKKQQFTELYSKMDAIDVAYARYKATKDKTGGVDETNSGDTACNIFSQDRVTPPIVVSQVDSYVAYLAEVFLSGSPLFPVVSRPNNRKWAEMLETLLDDHATLGAYPRQLLLFIRDCVKYNIGATEVSWDSIDQFNVALDIAASNGSKVQRSAKKFNRLKRLNMRNVVWDYSVNPGDVATDGDFAGYVERMTRTRMKRLLNKWTADNKVLNAERIMMSTPTSGNPGPSFKEDPQVSEYITNNSRMNNGVDWDNWFDPAKGSARRGPPTGQMYEVFTLYARIMPADFALKAPAPNTPQIWKFVIVNGQFVGFADRVISAYDALPILFGQPLEDGLGYQTQSVAESEMEFQEAAATLFNIRFSAARRAVADRALYIPEMIKPSDVNSAAAAPKIPVAISALSNKTIGDAYHQIPFDMRGTETTIQDAAAIVSFSQDLHGMNKPRQGQFQKGNKSVQEWDDTMGSSDGRLRLPALVLEYQFFGPLKSIMTLNIFQYAEDTKVISQNTGQEIEVDIDKLRQQVLSFRLADGYTPKSKLASTDSINVGMQLISNSPILQQAFGPSLPGMFIHFMSLLGAKGFEEYDPRNQPTTNPSGLPGNLPSNAIAPQGTEQPQAVVPPVAQQPASNVSQPAP